MPSRPAALCGTEAVVADPLALEVGRLRCELDDGAVRAITVDGVEVIRGIAYLVRDAGWGTPPALIEAPVSEGDATRFHVRWRGRIDQGAIRYAYAAQLCGRGDGTLEIEIVGRAEASFATNRCGFVILHPAAVGGLPVTVEHTDGTVEHTTFPTAISPAQPILAIRALTHEAAPGLSVTCRMEAVLPNDREGKFEMEDQRNWSDASFKTYVGSLLDPWPFTIEAGRELAQRVRIEVTGGVAGRPHRQGGAARLVLGPTRKERLPAIGLGLDPATAETVPAAAPLVARAGITSLVATADLRDPVLPARLAAWAALARAARAAVELELVLPLADDPARECGTAAGLCAAAGLVPASVLACPAAYLKSYQPAATWPDVPPLETIYAACRSAFPGALVGGGMHTYFTEFNRKPPPREGVDFVACTTSPLVHAADDRSVMQTLEALPAIAHSMAALAPGIPLRLGPSALPMRHNPYGDGLLPNHGNQRLAMAAQDPRQRGLFAAAWTIGYAAALAPTAIRMLTLNHVTGAAGIIAGRAAWPRPWFDDTPDALVHPTFHAVRLLARAALCPRLDGRVDEPRVACLAWQGGAGTELALANLGAEPVRLDLGGTFALRILDAASFTAACRDPTWLDTAPTVAAATLDLDAYASAHGHLPAA